ncbi:paired amphipathic helix protein Sin3b [Anthonomus grandis grandis]|uniref:paired amphipathic helix protein Sin3b n=1 Tax=Anthonomus grandis grandis TaxID=2921223 RepID=UPI002165C0A2|nr:paired amphipathic helix protein Sin3b [Anthonomus grandis grandis]XP_050306230.1 paired amphipathic helix protein Sin3b [Anthonomus grandis grandis]
MKRLRVDEPSKEGSGPPSIAPSSLFRSSLPNAAPGLAYPSGTTTVKVLNEGMQSGLYSQAPPVSYGTMPVAAAPHSGGKPQSMPIAVAGHNAMRTSGASPPNASLQEPPPQQSGNFQRLKVEDALSYLDLVKFKFGSKPQVYNDFLDIMKEFKSQSIDTPGVIERVSNLFKGFPDLIVGFNTFLPPGYKIEVRSDQGGYAFSVSVSMPSPTGTISSDQQKSAMILSGSGRIMPAPPSQPVGQPPPPRPISVQTQPPQQQSQPQPQQQQQQPPPQPPPQQQQQQQQSHQHIPSVLPQPPLAPPSVTHHPPSGYGMSAPTNYGLSLSAAQAAVTHALQGHTDTPQNQPVEFNHAINYVNKIKNRFQGQPEKYKRFLEILHTYQKEQRTMKESNVGANVKHLTEQEVYSQVAKLFENQSDLLAEFGQFLPDATSHINQAPVLEHSNSVNKKSLKPYHRDRDHLPDRHISHKSSHQSGSAKRSSSPYSSYHHRDAPPPKKHKVSPAFRDVSLSEAGKYGTLNDYAFFDKVRKALRSQEIYNNFLRCLILFNQEIISKSELLQVVTAFLGKFPELLKWFREFMSQNETVPIPFSVARPERPQGDHKLEIDFSTAKRLGASYCTIPKAQEGLKCSGRTQLCKEVLNDQWVSFPTWSSEDSTFVSSRKTQYEEYMYRCEDERFELDVVIETNASTIRLLESVSKKMGRMSADDLAKYRLDDTSGISLTTLHQKALKRVYGEKALDIIEGLKKNPAVAVSVILKRLKAKEDEWREAQKGFNKIWREQNEKYYLKSLDHQGINFKQTDLKAIRTKNLFNEIETIFDERHDQNEEGPEPYSGPHLAIPYRDKGILDDAANLLIHHVKRQTGIQKGEKRKIKQLLRQFLPDLFFHTRQPLSDDEREDEDENDDKVSPNSSPNRDGKESKSKEEAGRSSARSTTPEMKRDPEIKEEDIKMPPYAQTNNPEEAYTLFMANNNWYIFLRLHAILCERLLRIYERAVQIANEERQNGENRKNSTAIALRLKPKPQIEFEDYYPAFLDMVKTLLDGNMDANTYEDTLREMFGIHAYIAFTLDKVVSYAVRQLQHCVTERTAIGCTELYLKEHKRGAAGGACVSAHKRVHMEQAYQRAAEKVVQEENCFKIYIYKCDCKITIELLDTEPEDSKKVEEANKWNSYKESYTDIGHSENIKPKSPVYLRRNVRSYKQRMVNKRSRTVSEQDDSQNKKLQTPREDGPSNSRLDHEAERQIDMFEALERKLNERAPERNETIHPGFQVNDDQECCINETKINFAYTKDYYLYKTCAFYRARQSHPKVTKFKASKFRGWLKKWAGSHVTDSQSKQCTDWLMGRCADVVPNRTRVLADNDLQRTPYVPYNRYRVDRLTVSSVEGAS